MALNELLCTDVLLRTYSLTHSHAINTGKSSEFHILHVIHITTSNTCL